MKALLFLLFPLPSEATLRCLMNVTYGDHVQPTPVSCAELKSRLGVSDDAGLLGRLGADRNFVFEVDGRVYEPPRPAAPAPPAETRCFMNITYGEHIEPTRVSCAELKAKLGIPQANDAALAERLAKDRNFVIELSAAARAEAPRLTGGLAVAPSAGHAAAPDSSQGAAPAAPAATAALASSLNCAMNITYGDAVVPTPMNCDQLKAQVGAKNDDELLQRLGRDHNYVITRK